jgi:ribonuclease-3
MRYQTNYKKLLQELISNSRDTQIFKEAFTHTSYANEYKLPYSYERLEFLGDSILNSMVSKFIYDNFATMNEGEMSNLRSKAVCQDTLAELSLKFELEQFLLLGNGEEQSGGRKKNGILSDIFESFIAAFCLLGYKDKIEKLLSKTLFLKIKFNSFKNLTDYKTLLQEKIQSLHHHCYINYETIEE